LPLALPVQREGFGYLTHRGLRKRISLSGAKCGQGCNGLGVDRRNEKARVVPPGWRLRRRQVFQELKTPTFCRIQGDVEPAPRQVAARGGKEHPREEVRIARGSCSNREGHPV